VIGWAPDGQWIFFWSDRSGTSDIWAIQVSEGKAQDDPVLIQRGVMGDAYNVWMIPTGALFYSITVSTKDVYVAKIDFDQNKILEGPKKATQHYTDTNSVPAWSSDGEYLAFVSNRKDDPKKALCILSNKTGEIREFALDLLSWMNPTWIHWAPDGQSIIHTGFDKPSSCGFWRTDLNTGKMSMVLRFDPIKQIWGSCISKDGKTIYDIKMDKKTQKSQLVAQNLETQKIDELYVSEWLHALALSPDEQMFAFAEGEWPANMKLNTLPIKGGKSQTLHTFGKDEWPRTIVWTPDGRYILFSKGEEGSEENKEKFSLWRISPEGGEPKELGLNTSEISHLRIHPDGQHIAFHSGNRTEEIWVMENFLPKK
jgi:Tol biopolymer transport system component